MLCRQDNSDPKSRNRLLDGCFKVKFYPSLNEYFLLETNTKQIFLLVVQVTTFSTTFKGGVSVFKVRIYLLWN